jgi:hypothetical protein
LSFAAPAELATALLSVGDRFAVAKVEPVETANGFRVGYGDIFGEKSEAASSDALAVAVGFASECNSDRLGHTP